jgi:hypothetical protein
VRCLQGLAPFSNPSQKNEKPFVDGLTAESAHKTTITTKKNTAMEIRSQKDISTKWNLYTPQQQADILAEFRRKFPNDYYCRTTLFEFLNKKLRMDEDNNKVLVSEANI